MKVGDKIESVGNVDWVGYTSRPGPKVATGVIVAVPDPTNPSVIVHWDHMEPHQNTWMLTDTFRVVESPNGCD